MIEATVTTKKWGNSVGILLPKTLGIKPNQTLRIQLIPEKGFTKVKDIFGKLKMKTDTETLMRQIDKDLDID